MKNGKIFLLLQIIFATLFTNCASNKKVTEVSPPTTQTEVDQPIIWKQSYYPRLTLGDPLLFYNSSEIYIEGNFANQTFVLDGKLHRTDNIKEIIKTVEVITPGKLFNLKKDGNGRITDMFISFSQNDATYQFNFKLTSDGSYKLNGNAKLLFEGKEYPVLAKIKGEECKLLFMLEVDTNVEKVNEKAEGEDVSGTKTVIAP
ncbi:MAG TPA: hypothetical protein VK153_03380 [Candidatus Paceibacterota bacterium]|nr:hypothetical protein [Candidatus Paceibacterota bacterium]